MILPSLFLIAAALVKHLKASNQPEGVIYAAKYFRYLQDHPHKVSGLSRQAVTASLVDALAYQVEPEARNVMQCIEEMAVLCHELLTLEASDDHTTSSITLFARVVSSKITIRQRPVERYNSEEVTAARRFRFFGSIEGPETSSGNSQPDPALFFGDAPEIEPAYKKLTLIQELLSEICDPDITGIGEAVEKARTLLASAPTNLITSSQIYWFGLILFEAFQRTNKIEYLNESISTHCQLYEYPSSHFLRSHISHTLSTSLLTCFKSFPGHRTQDQEETAKMLSQCANNACVSLPTRFQYSCAWVFIARLILHPSVSKAYESAVSLMQDTLLFAPTLQQQHATLADPSFITHQVSLDYASYQVHLHQLEEAVETLERGRALLWSEMRHLRVSIDQLQQEHPQLGHDIDNDAADNSRGVDPFSRLLLKQRGLLKECDNLTLRIRALPGFNSFLTSPSFNTLRSTATSGPVIITNHSMFRSDILILLHNASPSLIPTARDFYNRAGTLKDKLLDSQNKYGLNSSHYDETLASVLAELYELVGKPVIDRLDQLQVPRQSRIWWCPTSVFCFLPLHAMGPIAFNDSEKRYFLDLYICSYTPMLSALIQSRNRDSGSVSLDRPSLLLIAQPDPSLPTVGGEIQVVQALNTEVTCDQ
ncbi:hypothetical protein EDB85DRAFT_2219210 [Lactarius pseudohatsudake]|nr:hypothetical protein EDB85DRAFT_2219210 [Lactarius pseudohatsudake]